MKKKILGLVGLLGASAVASMCVIPHLNYEDDFQKLKLQHNLMDEKVETYAVDEMYTYELNSSNSLKILTHWTLNQGNILDERAYSITKDKYYIISSNTFYNGLPSYFDYVGELFLTKEESYVLSSFAFVGDNNDFSSSGSEANSDAMTVVNNAIENRLTVKLYKANTTYNFVDDSGNIKYDFYLEQDSNPVLELSNTEIKPCDFQAPSIDGTNNFVVNVNNMLSKEEILSHITAIDDTDGVVDVVIDSTNYNPDSRQLGDYTMTVSATDRAGNKATATIQIKVVDIDKPTISGTNSYTVEYDEPVSLDTIKGALTVSDNYDTGLQLQLIQDNYTGHEREVGAHTITFKATDSSNNESDVYTVTVNVQDTKKPIITAPGTINVPTNTLYSLEELKSRISVEDGLDGTITEYTISGYENYQTNYKTVGNYTITITAKDRNNNTATASITITTEDKIAPEIWFNDHFIILGQGEELTEEMIREYASKVLGISVDAIAEVTGDYNTNELGVYKMSVKTITGEAYTFSLFVDEQTHPEIVDLDWWDRVWKGLSVAFGIEDGYKADGFFDWFGDLPERFGLCWDIWSTGKMEVRTGTLPEKEESTPVVEPLVSEVAFKNRMLVDEYVIEF